MIKANEDVQMIAADVPAVFAKVDGPPAQTEEDIQQQATWIPLTEERGGAFTPMEQETPQIPEMFQATQHAELSLHQPLPSQQQVLPNQQTEEISLEVRDFKNQFPLKRIKTIMKADEDVKMIATDVPPALGKACEWFIEDLSHRSYMRTQERQGRILLKQDIVDAISTTDSLDFLTDIFLRDKNIE